MPVVPKGSGETPVGLAGGSRYPRERVNGPLTRERSAVPGDEPVDPDDHHRPLQGGSLPNTVRLGKFLLARRVPRAEVIERLRVGAVELAEGARPSRVT